MALVKDRYTYVDFRDAHAVPLFAKTTNAIATAADNQEDYMWVDGKHYFEHIPLPQRCTEAHRCGSGLDDPM